MIVIISYKKQKTPTITIGVLRLWGLHYIGRAIPTHHHVHPTTFMLHTRFAMLYDSYYIQVFNLSREKDPLKSDAPLEFPGLNSFMARVIFL